MLPMVVMHEMIFVGFHDIAGFAEAWALARLACDVARVVTADGGHAAVDELQEHAERALAQVTSGLQAALPSDELRAFRLAQAAVADLRDAAYEAYRDGALSAPLFDELMSTSRRAARELVALEVWARRQALRRMEGLA